MLDYIALLLAALCMLLPIPLIAYTFVLSARDVFSKSIKNALLSVGACSLWLLIGRLAAWRVASCNGESCAFPFEAIDSIGYAVCLVAGIALLRLFIKRAHQN